MRQKLTPEGLEALIKMAEDNKAPIDIGLISALEELHSALIRRMARSLESMTAKAKTLEERTERYKILLKGNPAEGEFTETGLDSADVADALLYQLQTLRTYKLSRAKVMAGIKRRETFHRAPGSNRVRADVLEGLQASGHEKAGVPRQMGVPLRLQSGGGRILPQRGEEILRLRRRRPQQDTHEKPAIQERLERKERRKMEQRNQ